MINFRPPKSNMMLFGDLDAGDTFFYEDDLFIKTNTPTANNFTDIVSLNDGKLIHLNNKVEVEQVDINAEIKHKEIQNEQ